MSWRLTQTYVGWIIEYKSGLFSPWKQVINHRSYSFEPYETVAFSTKEEAALEMSKLVSKYM